MLYPYSSKKNNHTIKAISSHFATSSSIVPDAAEIRAHQPIHAAPEPPVPSVPLLVPLPVLGQYGAVSDPILATDSLTAAGAGDEPGQDGDVAQDAGCEGRLGEEGFGDGA